MTFWMADTSPWFVAGSGALELSLLEFGRGATGYVRRERWQWPQRVMLCYLL